MKEKDDTLDEELKPKKSSIAKFASISTLSDEELAEANASDDNEEYEEDVESDDVSYEENDAAESDDYETEPEPESAADDTPMEHFGDIIRIEAHPSAGDVIRFMFRHTYISGIGFVAMAVSVLSLVYAIVKIINGEYITALLAGVAFGLFAIYTPLNLAIKSKKHAQTLCTPEGTITYTFSDAGLDISRGGEYAKYEWSHVVKVVNGKGGYYVYLSKTHAFIAPKCDLAEKEETFKKLIKSHVDAKSAKI